MNIKIMQAIRLLPAAVLFFVAAGIATPASSADMFQRDPGVRQFYLGGVRIPEDITVEEAKTLIDFMKRMGKNITLREAVERGIEHNRTVKGMGLDFESAQNKVSETRAQFGFDLKVESNYQKVHDNTAFPMLTYRPAGLADVIPLDPVTNLPTGPAAPTVVASGIPTVESIPISSEWPHGAEVKITKAVFTFGKRGDAVKAAKENREIKKLDIRISELDTVLQIHKQFHAVLLAYKTLVTLIETLGQTEHNHDAAQSRFDAGISPKLDVIRAESDVRRAREDIVKAVKYFELARMSLNNLIGIPVEDKIWTLEEGAYSKIEMAPLEFYTDLALDSRHELEQIEMAQELARIQARLAKKKPTVAFAGNWSFYNKGSGLFGSEHTWRAILAASVPVFDGGVARSQEAQARRLEDKLILNETDLREGIQLQVKQAYLTMVEAESRLQTSAKIMETAEEGYRMADLGFKEGVTAQIDLLDAENMLTQAKLNADLANYDYEMAKADLARACGFMSLEEVQKTGKE